MRYQIASLLAIAIVTLAFGGYAAAAQKPKSESTRKKPGVNPDAQVIVDFNKRINAYVELHKKLEATLPTLPKEATPQQIDVHERALAKLVQAARADAKPGDLFSPGMQVIVRRILGQVFRGPDGRQIKNSILDESGERAVVKLTINGRYPDEVPISTVRYYGDIHHVALYLGGGRIVHAPGFGVPVRVDVIGQGPVAGYGRPTG